MTDGPEDDIRAIRRVHRQWWAANRGLDVERMAECFAPDYLMWNLNSHPYFSLEEKRSTSSATTRSTWCPLSRPSCGISA